jgi:PAS domain S-box-containing protein
MANKMKTETSGRGQMEAALHESEEKLRSLFDSMSEMVVLHELVRDEGGKVTDYRILECNPAFSQITGIPQETAVGALGSQIYGARAVPYLDLFAQVAESGQPVLFETYFAPMEKNFSISVFSQGPDRFATVTTDITERKRGEQERETTIKLLRLLNAPNDLHTLMRTVLTFFAEWSGCEAAGIRLREGEDYPYFVTRGFSKEFVQTENFLCVSDLKGQLRRDEMGNPILECMCGNILHRRFNSAKPFFTEHGSFWTNSTTQLLGGTTQADRQSGTRNRCNQEGYESVALVPLRMGDTTFGLVQIVDRRRGRFSREFIGQLERMADNVAIALSQRKAEKMLRESEARFRRTFDQSPIGEALVFLNFRFMRANEAFCRIVGFTEEELQSRSFTDITHPDNQTADLESVQDLLAGKKEQYNTEKRYIRKDGQVVWAQVSVRLVKDEAGQPLYFLPIIEDITARKQAEEEVRKLTGDLERRVTERTTQLEVANRELEMFAYSVSHDLRAPLRGIDGFGKVLLEGYGEQLNERGQDLLRRIREAGGRMGQLIDDLLHLSRVTRSEIHRIPVDLSELATSIAAELAGVDPRRQVVFVIVPGLVAQADPRLMRIVMENLLRNAWKFTGKHPRARIEVGVLSPSHPGEEVVFFVRDDGAGFDMAYADKIFGPFQRLHRETEFEGTGIGLATVQRIVHRHGGRVWAEGAVEKGATFYFTLG